MTTHHLIVGTGRCGTGFAAELLTQLGYPTTHEGIFNPYVEPPVWDHSIEGEASWLAVPHLNKLPPDVQVVHLIRNPLEVMRSMTGIRWLACEGVHLEYEEFAINNLPPIAKYWVRAYSLDDLLWRSAFFIDNWIKKIEKHVEYTVKVEDLDKPETIVDMVYYLTGDRPKLDWAVMARATTSSKINTRPRYEKLEWKDMPESVRQIAVKYGYPVLL